MNENQRRWQAAALEALLAEAGKHDRGPWIPAASISDETQSRAGCTKQAAVGALRALLTVGLADRFETHEGLFWKATDAAERMFDLVLAPREKEIT